MWSSYYLFGIFVTHIYISYVSNSYVYSIYLIILLSPTAMKLVTLLPMEKVVGLHSIGGSHDFSFSIHIYICSTNI